MNKIWFAKKLILDFVLILLWGEKSERHAISRKWNEIKWKVTPKLWWFVAMMMVCLIHKPQLFSTSPTCEMVFFKWESLFETKSFAGHVLIGNKRRFFFRFHKKYYIIYLLELFWIVWPSFNPNQCCTVTGQSNETITNKILNEPRTKNRLHNLLWKIFKMCPLIWIHC